MQNAKSKAGSTSIDRRAVVVFSVLMIAVVLGGLGYAAHEFSAIVNDMRTTFEQAGQGISACFGPDTHTQE